MGGKPDGEQFVGEKSVGEKAAGEKSLGEKLGKVCGLKVCRSKAHR